jgi:hypothetical protein
VQKKNVSSINDSKKQMQGVSERETQAESELVKGKHKQGVSEREVIPLPLCDHL